MSTLDSFALDAVLQTIQKYSPQSVCDYGYGDGEMFRKIAKSYPTIDLYGIEKSKTVTYSVKQNSVTEIPDIIGTKSKIHPCFDLIISLFTFHHFESPSWELNNISHLLRSGGKLLLVDLIESPNVELAQRRILIDALTELVNFHAGIMHRRPYSLRAIMDYVTPLSLQLNEHSSRDLYFTHKQKKQYTDHHIAHYKTLLKELSCLNTPYKEIIQVLINLHQDFSLEGEVYHTSVGSFLFEKH